MLYLCEPLCETGSEEGLPDKINGASALVFLYILAHTLGNADRGYFSLGVLC